MNKLVDQIDNYCFNRECEMGVANGWKSVFWDQRERDRESLHCRVEGGKDACRAGE